MLKHLLFRFSRRWRRRLKLAVLASALMLLASPMFALERAQGPCAQGGKVIVAPAAVGGSPIQRDFIQSYPNCTVNVYLTGTGTLAAIYSTSGGTPLANPFTADSTGWWFFYAEGTFDVQISGGGPPALPAPYTFGGIKLQDLPSAADYGAQCNGVHDDTAALAAAFTATVGKSLYIPAGTCVVNNSSAAFTVTNWSGRLWGNVGSVLACTTLANNCVIFASATNMNIEDLSFTFTPATTTRNGAQLLDILSGTHVDLRNISAYNGNSAAVLIQQGTDIHITDLHTYNMLANGLFITNSSYVTVTGLYCNSVQDYCMEASQYDSPSVPGGTCQFVNVSNMNSVSSFSGALFNGCPNSSLSNFSITDTFNAGVVVGQDHLTTVSAWPFNVAISNGSIRNTGTTPSNPNAQGIYLFLDTAPSRTVPVAFSNILVYNTAADGVEIGKDAGGDVSNFNVTLANVVVDTTGVNGVGYRFAAAGTVTFSGLQARNAYAYGLDITGTAGTSVNVSGSNLFFYDDENPARSDPRVLLAQNTGTLFVNGITLVDDRNPAAGYELADSGAGLVQVMGIVPILAHGTLALSPGTAANEYLIFNFFKYNPQTIQVDATGTACQLTVGGFTTPAEILKLCYDTTGDFGWIQATHTGTGNKLLKLNPNGGGLDLAGCFWTVGSGGPNGTVTGSPCDIYMNNAGGAGTTLYVKESGTATNTGWVGK